MLARPCVAVLSRGPRATAWAEAWAGEVDLEVVAVADVPALLAQAGRVTAAVADLDLPEAGWPVAIGEDVDAKVPARLPLILICPSAHDATVLRKRVSRRTVVLDLNSDAPHLTQVVLGHLAALEGARVERRWH